ncbi:MAG TPA: hypothetical protein V6D17_01680 [Candidatus Obscuribacterales bacterium]
MSVKKEISALFSVLATFLCLCAAPEASAQQGNGLANYSGPGAMQSAQAAAQPRAVQGGPLIQQWFQKYDQVRRQAQMNPAERQKADNLLSKGLSIIVPGEEKVVTQNLLNKLVLRYQTAAEQMKLLPLYGETERLHRGYYQYFCDAGKLFSDYLKVQNNLFAVDEATGKPLASTLMQRKQSLEMLDQGNKALDEQLRNQFGIPPYQY